MFRRDEEDRQNCLLVIQCDSGNLNGDLIACARYRIYDQWVNALNKNKFLNRDGVTHVLFIINLPHQVFSSSFVGFQGDPWISYHIDDLRPVSCDTIETSHAIAMNISELFIGECVHDIAPFLEGTLAEVPQLLQVFQEKGVEESSTNLATAKTSEIIEPGSIAYHESPSHFNSAGSDEHQAGVPHESVALPSVDESVTQLRASLSTEPEVILMTADMNSAERTLKLEIFQTAQKLWMRQTPSGQCRRLYGCIQAAASRLEDSAKDRSMQRVTHLTKLIQRSPKHLGK